MGGRNPWVEEILAFQFIIKHDIHSNLLTEIFEVKTVTVR